MGARNAPMANGTGSRARAIESYYPFYPPPVYPIEQTVRNSPVTGASVVQSVVDERTDKGIVNSKWNRWGDRSRYSFGGVMNRVFHMRATGQVESTVAQPITNMPHIAQFNDFLYRAAKGYPRNLGLSEKVPTLPVEALGQNPWGQMGPRTQLTRNVFTNRNYSTVKQTPAKPSNA